MRQYDPIFFTEPSGSTRRPRTLHKGGGGGDGGAAAREAAEKARIAQAVKKINAIFAIGKNDPAPVSRDAFVVDGKTDRRGQLIIPQGYVKEQVAAPKSNSPWGPSANMGNTIYDMGMGWQRGNTRKLFNQAGYQAAVAKAAADAEAKNQAALAGREGTYTKIGQDFRNKAMVDLNKERDVLQRDLGFMVARQGLSGGSRDIDVNRAVLDTYQQGALRAADMGTQATNNARAADDRTRVDLITAINAGLDEGSAMQQAYEGMRNNAKSAQDEANLASLSGFFDTLRANQANAAYRDGFNQSVSQYPQKTNASIYGRTGGTYQGKTGGNY